MVLVLVLPIAAATAAPADSAAACAGDCQGTGTVAISSLITLVRIVLGIDRPAACAFGIPSDASIDVALSIRAVNNALAGCVGPLPTFTATPSGASTATATATVHGGACPPGQHKACHGGSGRGGGYKTICACVADPPPVCTTAWGTTIAAGSTLTLYDVNLVYAPDTCAAHGLVVACDANGMLDPLGATGYPVCTIVSDAED